MKNFFLLAFIGGSGIYKIEELKNQKWINTKTNIQNDIKIENAILNKAKKIRLKT